MSTQKMLERAIAIFRPNATTLSLASDLLREYCSQFDVMVELKPCLAQIAMFVADSVQELNDTKGRRISIIGLSMSRLISNCISIPLVLNQLLKFIKCVSLDNRCKLQMKQYTSKAIEACQIINHFGGCIDSLQLTGSECTENTSYKEIFCELAWILFIDCKENYFKCSGSANIKDQCLLASVFYFMVRYSLDYIYPKQLKKDRCADKRTLVGKIIQLLLNVFSIQDIDEYKRASIVFDEYAQHLINTLTLRALGSDTDFFAPLIVQLNYKQIQNRYQKSLKPNNIDMRVFRKQKSLTPINKDALFYRVGVKKYDSLSKSVGKQYKSHKMLSYEDAEVNQVDRSLKLKSQTSCNPQIWNKRKPHEFRPHSSFTLESGTKNKHDLPQGVNLEIYRYIRTTVTPLSKDQHLQEHIVDSMRNLIQKQSKFSQNSESYLPTLLSLYSGLARKIFCEQTISNEEDQQCLIVISMFMVSSMYETYNSQDRKTISNYLIHKNCKLLVTLWQSLQFLIEHDQDLPVRLLNAFRISSQEIICFEIWQSGSYIDSIAELAANYEKPAQLIKLTESLIIYCEDFIKDMQKQLKMSVEHCILTYNCIKFILSVNGSILQGHHIDQILMCSIYIAGKTSNFSVLFVQIKQAYQSMTKNKFKKLERIFNKVIEDEEGAGDIIYFYNKYFINTIQPFIPYMANPSLQLLHPLFQRQLKINNQREFENQKLLINEFNIQDTKKPKPPSGKSLKNQQHSQTSLIQQEKGRNQTRVRPRPNVLVNVNTGKTEKIKLSPNQSYYDNQ